MLVCVEFMSGHAWLQHSDMPDVNAGTEAQLQTLTFDDTESKPGKALAIGQAAFETTNAVAEPDEDDLLDLLDSVA